MEENKFGTLSQTTATPVTNPTTEMTKIMSNEFLKIFELKEYCKFVESDLKKCYNNVQTLTSAKNEASKLIAEYKSRNKVNATNSESLLQALNELYKYKCELKSCYIATQKAFKSKKLKFKKIISSYESAWEKALNEYAADPVAVELREIEQENELLQREIEKKEKLDACTKIQFVELKQKSEKAFLEKSVNFAKAMLQYADFLKSAKQYKENEPRHVSKRKFEFKFLKTEVPQHAIEGQLSPDNIDDANYGCSFDISVFDDIMVPSENLESQHLEEDAYSFGQNNERQTSDVSRDPEEGLGNFNNKTSAQIPKENLVQADPKPQKTLENESQYFRSRGFDSSKQIVGESVKETEQWNRNAKKTNKSREDMDGGAEKSKPVASALRQVDNEEEAPKDLQMESEESLGEASYEKQFGNQRADRYECQRQKPWVSSMSSDELPGDNKNVSENASRMFCDQNAEFKPEEPQLKESDNKSFTGFFTMGTEQDASKPSIFKLF